MAAILKAAENRGRAYRCMRCKTNPFTAEKYRVLFHFYKKHVALDQAPFYCGVCLFVCTNLKDLHRHRDHYASHKAKLAEWRAMGHPIDELSLLHINPNPYVASELDIAQLSESKKVWESRRKSASSTGAAAVSTFSAPSVLPTLTAVPAPPISVAPSQMPATILPQRLSSSSTLPTPPSIDPATPHPSIATINFQDIVPVRVHHSPPGQTAPQFPVVENLLQQLLPEDDDDDALAFLRDDADSLVSRTPTHSAPPSVIVTPVVSTTPTTQSSPFVSTPIICSTAVSSAGLPPPTTTLQPSLPVPPEYIPSTTVTESASIMLERRHLQILDRVTDCISTLNTTIKTSMDSITSDRRLQNDLVTKMTQSLDRHSDKLDRLTRSMDNLYDAMKAQQRNNQSDNRGPQFNYRQYGDNRVASTASYNGYSYNSNNKEVKKRSREEEEKKESPTKKTHRKK